MTKIVSIQHYKLHVLAQGKSVRALTPKEILSLKQVDSDISEVTITGHPPSPPSYPPPFPPPPPAPPPSGGSGGGGVPPPAPKPPCAAHPTLNWSPQTLVSQEGGVQTKGYVPTSTSGATIGGGIDLSRQFASTLTSWGATAATITAMKPYFATGPGKYGPTGSTAAGMLAKTPLVITSAQASLITTNANAAFAASTSNQFDNLRQNATGVANSNAFYDLQIGRAHV